MNTKVLKFGGSSLADANQFRKVAEIIKADPANRYVVASAPGKRSSDDIKVTDMLIRCFEMAGRKENVDEVFSQVEARYNGIISDLGLDFSLAEDFEMIRMALRLRTGRDYVVSRGEYLNSKILANYLGWTFVDAEDGIFFKEDGTFDEERTYPQLQKLLENVDYAVVPGFYGSMPNGTIRTFSRGGSDISGAIVARAVDAAIYENWTDVSGMLMADPRIVKNPRVIEEITYRELRELAYMGATVMHEEAVFPVEAKSIPINIRNTNDPSAPGTMIVPPSRTKQDALPTVITGIAGIKGFSAIKIGKNKMNVEIGFGRKVLSILERMNISFEHIPSGIDTISVIVRTKDIENRKEDLIARIYRDTEADYVDIDGGLALIATAGRGMIRAKGCLGRLCTAVGSQNINIRMINLCAEEDNIIIGVEEENFDVAMNAIYHEFVRE